MDRKKIEKASIDKEALNKILAPFDRGFLIKQIWDEEPNPSRRSTICIRFQRGNWTKLEIMMIKEMLNNLSKDTLSYLIIVERVDLDMIIGDWDMTSKHISKDESS